MATAAWQLEGTAIGVGNEISNSLADRLLSLQAEAEHVDHHLHNRARWRGKLAVQTATDWADDTLTPFQAISGSNDYGSDPGDEAQVIGTADTPILAGMTKYDPYRLFIVDASSTTIYKLRIVHGTGTLADAITAGQFSEVMIKLDAAAAQVPHAPVEITMERLNCGVDKLWVQCWNATDNATIDFYIGWHEYEE